MQENGVDPDQVVQIRGYSDQQLRKPDSPEDPSNRRISLIVQYLAKKEDGDSKGSDAPKPEEAPPKGEHAEAPAKVEP